MHLQIGMLKSSFTFLFFFKNFILIVGVLELEVILECCGGKSLCLHWVMCFTTKGWSLLEFYLVKSLLLHWTLRFVTRAFVPVDCKGVMVLEGPYQNCFDISKTQIVMNFMGFGWSIKAIFK